MLVGRRYETDALLQLLAGARASRSGAVVLRGEAEYHLRKVFMKLGIASRAELIRHGVTDDLVTVS